jgi:hypothetical protein
LHFGFYLRAYSRTALESSKLLGKTKKILLAFDISLDVGVGPGIGAAIGKVRNKVVSNACFIYVK